MALKIRQKKSWGFLLLILLVLAVFYLTDLKTYFNFSTLKAYHQTLQLFVENYFLFSLLMFGGLYVGVAATSLPIAAFLTILGGFLFGPFLNLVVVDISATLGATLLFLAVKTTFGELLQQKATPWIKKMEKGFQENAFSYLLSIRLVPLFPFWAVTIVAALLNTPLRFFVGATLIGIIPGTFIYSLLGNGLTVLLEQEKQPDLSLLFEPAIFLPLCGLALLSLLPIVYKKWKKNHES